MFVFRISDIGYCLAAGGGPRIVNPTPHMTINGLSADGCKICKGMLGATRGVGAAGIAVSWRGLETLLPGGSAHGLEPAGEEAAGDFFLLTSFVFRSIFWDKVEN